MTVTLITFLHFPNFVCWFASAIVILEMPEFTTQVWSDFMQPHCICSPQFPNPAPASVPAGFECSWIWPGPAPSGFGKLESSASLLLVESDTCSVYRGKTEAPGNCSGNGAKVCSITAVTGSANTVTLREWGKHAAKVCQPHRGDSASAGILSSCSLHTNCEVADPKILKRGGDNLSAPSSFIANAHNEIYAFYAEKNGFLTKIWANRGGGGAATPPLNPPLNICDMNVQFFLNLEFSFKLHAARKKIFSTIHQLQPPDHQNCGTRGLQHPTHMTEHFHRRTLDLRGRRWDWPACSPGCSE